MARRILLVDDDIAAIATVRKALAREGLQVLLATSAADGVVALAHHDPEVVLLAPAIEGGIGGEVRRAIAQDRRHDRILVLLLGDGQEPIFAGDAVFEKPVDPLAVLAAIRSQFPGEVGSVVPSWTMDEPGDSLPDLGPEEPAPEEPEPPPKSDAPEFFDGSPWSLPPSPLKRTELARAEAQERIRRIAEEARVAVETRRGNENTSPPGEEARSLMAREAMDPDATGEMEIPAGLRAALARAEPSLGALEHTMVEAPKATPRPRVDPPPPPQPKVPPSSGEVDLLQAAVADLRAQLAKAQSGAEEELERARADAASARRLADLARSESQEAETERARLTADLAAMGERAARLQTELAELGEENGRLNSRLAALGPALEAEKAALSVARAEAEGRATATIDAAREEAEALARESIEMERAQARREAVEAIARSREEADARVREGEERSRLEAEATVARAHKELEAKAREAVENARAQIQEKTRKLLAESAAAAEGLLAAAKEEAAAELDRVRVEMEARGKKSVEEARTQGHRAVEEIRAAGEGQLRKAVEETRRALERTRAAGEETLAKSREESAALLAAAEEERARLESDLALSRGVADELHARGEELRRKLQEMQDELEEQGRRAAVEAEDAAAGIRRAEADAARRLSEEVARATALTRREVEEEMRRSAQEEAERRADSRRRTALEARRTPVPGIEPPSALQGRLRNVESDASELPFPTSLPAAMEEPLPEPAPGELPPTEGPFADAGRLLMRLARASFTGRLDLELAGGRRTLWLEGGRIVGARSDAPGERLEDIALREGRITREQRSWARTAPAAGARQLAAMLSERGYLKAAELVPLVRGRVTEIAFAAFERDGGSYGLTSAEVDPEERVALPGSTAALVTEGIRRKYVAERLHRKIGGPGTLLRPVENPGADEPGLTSREKRIVALADGLRTLDELLLDAGEDETFALRALWASVVAGNLEVAVRGLPPAEEGGSLDRLRIQEKHRQAREADYFELLGLPRTCTAYEVDEAYERLVHEFSLERHAGLGDGSLPKLLREIQSVLGDARDVLRDDRLRVEYARNLSGAGVEA